MRLFFALALIGAFILACASEPAAKETYPTVVAEGTYVSLAPTRDGYAIALVYTDQEHHLMSWIFRVETFDTWKIAGTETVSIPDPLYPGNAFVLTKTGPAEFTLAKAQ
ncbi:hypothetical protein A2348_04415 [Candidatus Uhrbacteria bacterium RIFOXYB12_FULL_58_10]|uniref:Uncharacterized protein n=1 Tax=Candidatus Uhrbacteria bacterium RIFOXYB2_FULL_57_15 TaxID=1802422 RepID=A0A1F7W978_9BACT|nr:MAG: hypothetical protein A2348_04415 [Candidatus Uhrbacteria bacterium RIFOXYB12_FULL_58_10]OGL98757.1 MAG: hypothetical protein A2304_01085 [Candidatus Uhrbacteria bacterium RIFOXYB2_FULL_57_15]OGL99962.1 MAG: hypothetical protein A2501_04415 [Candidatus Uhrbacteria bacterium RIFOXYC12_FULL_57_11]